MSVPGRILQILDSNIPRRRGRPPLIWTPSQQRKLVRLVADANVPWKDIDVAMEEPGWAPKKGNCRKQWKMMTDMNPSQLQVTDPIKKERRRQQALRAFEAYQQRQPQTFAQKNDPYSKPTPNASTVPPLLEVATPADSMAEMQTPQYFSHPAFPFDISQEILDASATPDQAQSPAQTLILNREGKQPTLFELGLAASTSPIRDPTFYLNPSSGLENIPAQANQAPASRAKTTIVQESRADSHYVVDSENVVNEGPIAIAKIEDEMSVPRGFIDFFKFQLTITRDSVASALSSSESFRLPWSRRRSRDIQSNTPQKPHEARLEGVSQQHPPESQAENQWTQIVPPMETNGRANTDLFWELQLAGSTDKEIASRLETLITAGANPNARSPGGEAPLHVALRLGNLPACQVLLDRGADVHVKTLDGKSLLEYGKTVQNLAGNTGSQYVAIKACRYAIKEYDPRQKATAVSKLAPKVISPLAGQKHGREQDGDMNVGSRMKSPPEFNLGKLEGRQPLHTQEPGFSTYGEGPPGAMPSDNPFRNMNFNSWDTNAEEMTARNSEDHESASSSFNPDLHSTSDMLPIPYLEQIPSHPPRRSSLSVQKLVEQFDSRQSSMSSSLFPPTRNNNLAGGHNQDLSPAFPYSGTQNLQGAISQIPNTSSSRFRHRRAPYTLNGQSDIPISTQQSSQSLRPEIGLPLEPVSNSTSPTRLSGYLTTLTTGQMALVCPLSTNASWQYAEQELNDDYSPAAVRIISPPSTTGALPIPIMSQGQAVQVATGRANLGWTEVEPRVQQQQQQQQQQPASLVSNGMENNVKSQSALNSNFVDGWDYSRPGFNS